MGSSSSSGPLVLRWSTVTGNPKRRMATCPLDGLESIRMATLTADGTDHHSAPVKAVVTGPPGTWPALRRRPPVTTAAAD
jgi:hypothetical protein